MLFICSTVLAETPRKPGKSLQPSRHHVDHNAKKKSPEVIMSHGEIQVNGRSRDDSVWCLKYKLPSVKHMSLVKD